MTKTLKLAAVLGIAVLACAPGAWAQGCVLCYTSIAAAGSAAMHNFEIAMLVLLVPALLLFAGLFLMIFLRARAAEMAQSGVGSLALRNRLGTARLFAAARAIARLAARPVEGRA